MFCAELHLLLSILLKIWFVDRTLLGMSAITIQVDLVISLTLIIEIIFAKMVGCVFPILAKKNEA